MMPVSIIPLVKGLEACLLQAGPKYGNIKRF
jgi:hypothetical protein